MKRSGTQNWSKNFYFGKRLVGVFDLGLIWECHGMSWYHMRETPAGISFFLRTNSQIAAGKSAFLWHMEFDRWSICYAVLEMSELCNDQRVLLCESKSLRLQIMEMMGDDPNIINVWWADEQMNDDQHPAISSYWLTWSFTKPLADSSRCYVSFVDFGSKKVNMWHYKERI